MIDINNFTIIDNGTALSVSVETDLNETITSALVWTDQTFKDYSQAIDVTSYLAQTSNIENFTLPASVFGVNELQGIYFIEFQTTSGSTDDCVNCSNNLGVAASLLCFKECLLDKVLQYSVCDDISNENCNESIVTSIINIDVLVDALCTSLEFGYYGEAIDILKTLRKLCNCSEGCSECNQCKDCKDLPSPNFKSGLDYGTLDNTLILV